MKINRFVIKAFGPFTDRELNFSGKSPGLHIVFGPNEAGKSSSLRALKAWLFGFPERTTDNFLHPNPKLLVGGTLKNDDGDELSFFRRKRRGTDIVDSSGTPLQSSLLESYLLGLDSRLFELLYGLNHDSLLRGGREMLARNGEVGQALFSAGAGMASLHEIVAQLEKEGLDLYKVKGQNPAINQAINLHKRLKKEVRDLSLQPEQWSGCYEQLQDIEKTLLSKEKERRELARELHYYERLEQALPLLLRLKKLRRLCPEKETVRHLPDGFSEQRIRVEKGLESSAVRRDQAEKRLSLLQKKTAELVMDDQLLEQEENIEQKLQRLGEYEKALRDRPRLEGIQAMHRKEGERLLNLVWPGHMLEDVDALLPLHRQRRTILELISRHKVLFQALEDGRKRLAAAEKRLQQVKKKAKKLPVSPDTLPLYLAINAARRIGDVDSMLETKRNEILVLRSACTDKLQQAGLWQGGLDALPDIQFPALGTVSQHVDTFRELHREKNRLHQEEEQAIREQARLHSERKKLEYGGGVPEESDLLAVREKRDKGWQLIRRAWVDREEIGEEARQWDEQDDLAGTFQQLINRADMLSDRLRFEADRVQSYAAIKVREEETTRHLQSIADHRKEVSVKMNEQLQTWKALWEPYGVDPLSPAEMVEWLAGMSAIREQAVELRQLVQSEKVLRSKRDEAVSLLRSNLSDIKGHAVDGEQLSPLLLLAEAQHKENEQLADEVKQLHREEESCRSAVVEAKQDQENAANEFQAWQTQWDAVAQIPEHDISVSLMEATDSLEYINQIFITVDSLNVNGSRIKGIDRDCRAFEKEVGDLAKKIAPDLNDMSVPQAMSGLRARLNRVRQDQALRSSYEAEREELILEIGAAKAEYIRFSSQFDELCSIAGCEKKEDIVFVEQDAKEYGRLIKQIEEIENDLLPLSGEMELSVFEERAAAVDSDGIPGRIHELRRKIEQECDPDIRRLAERKGEEQKVLAQMDGSALAAEKAEEIEQNLARLGGLVERYVRLQFAGRVLHREIERFRGRHQDPILGIGSKLFAALTMQSFSGLSTDIDDRGEPILVGLRDKSRLDVEAMSTGTRDQLYLSLRLATIRHRAESGQTMPFIVDDILINFDDARSRATLEVLAELGRINQVILFTHHGQLVREGESMVEHGVHIHHLGN